MSLLLPMDDNGNPIAVLGYDYRGTQKIAVGSTSERNAEPFPSYVEIVTIVATSFCRFEIGDATVTADAQRSPILFPGQYLDIPLRAGERYIAFLADQDECDAYVIARI
jgi:hypothetical protein